MIVVDCWSSNSRSGGIGGGGKICCWKKTAAANWVVEMLLSNDKQAKNPTEAAAVDDQW